MGEGVDADSRLKAVNPFAGPEAVQHSNYCMHDGTRLVRAGSGAPSSALTTLVHDSFLALAMNPHFPCVGAKSALRGRAYRFGLYPELGSIPAAAGLARDLYSFLVEAPALGDGFRTFLASFEGPVITGEADFETLLWETLQYLHELDAPHHAWDPGVSADPEDPRFSFSFGGTAFFVVGLHAASSRAARRFAWPTMAFNAHRQFDELRAQGHYDRFQKVIRSAERSLQGDTNPMLADFGERSEAAQYSGRNVLREEWRCPFRAAAPRGTSEEEKE